MSCFYYNKCANPQQGCHEPLYQPPETCPERQILEKARNNPCPTCGLECDVPIARAMINGPCNKGEACLVRALFWGEYTAVTDGNYTPLARKIRAQTSDQGTGQEATA